MMSPDHTWDRRWLPWLVLAGALVCTAAVAYQLHHAAEDRNRQAFENNVTQMASALTDRLNNDVALLQTTAGYFAASPTPPRGEFTRFINHLQLERHFVGVSYVGFAPRISAAARASFEEDASAQFDRAIRIWPGNGRAEYFPVVRAAPVKETTPALFGWDLAHDPRVQAAMTRARDRAAVTMTEEIRQSPFPELEQGHVFALFPVYDGYSIPETVPERNARLSGYAFLIISTDSLMRRAFPLATRPGFSIALYDFENAQDPLLQSGLLPAPMHKPLYETRVELPVPGRSWVLEVKRWPPEGLFARFGLGSYTAILGSLLSLLIFCIVWIQAAARTASEHHAAALRQSEERLRELNESLEQRVSERTAEAEQRAAQLRAMALQLSQAEQQERQRLAQILHDDLQQMLVAVRLRIDRIKRAVTNQDQSDDLAYADELLAQAIQAARSLSVDLSPPILRERGLAPALEWLARKMQAEHGLTVHLDVREDVTLNSDEAKHFVVQAVRELLFNVVKHAGVTEAWLTLTVAGPCLELSVLDRGEGFDLTTELAAHNGCENFGLATIRHRIDLIGGSSDVQTNPGEGCHVRFRIPRDIEAEPEDEPEADAPAPAPVCDPLELAAPHDARDGDRKIRVLLVDDHKIVRQGLAGLLAGESDIALVGEASDGVDALDQVRRIHPDVVIMDITMPRMNGIEATRHITQEHPGIRVIGLSMHEKDDMELAMRAAGAETYLSKDGAATALVDAIRGAAEVRG